MENIDITFWMGGIMGAIAGYSLGHGRGYIAGVRWCTKRLNEPTTEERQRTA